MRGATLEITTPAVQANDPSDSFSYVFSALKGIQAGRDYYVAMCPLKLIPNISFSMKMSYRRNCGRKGPLTVPEFRKSPGT